MSSQLYPLKFNPILKDRIWGGVKLKQMFGKQDDSDKLGESWELSSYNEDVSVVANGHLEGALLSHLVELYKSELIGDVVYEKFGHRFPLLFKLIDAADNLSIQVHPGDEVAAHRHHSFGKTEMWYVIDAEPEASLVLGFSQLCNKQKYLDALQNGQVEELLQRVPVHKGDVLYIPSGTIHAIGKGVVVAEIQQSSDITYRIYDYKRKDEQGLQRELHTELALEVIDFSPIENTLVKYTPVLNEISLLVQCEYFTVNILHCNKVISRDYHSFDSFVVYMCLDGQLSVKYSDTEEVVVSKGETILIPASIKALTLIPDTEATLLEVYVE